MISVPAGTRIVVATEPVDGRKGMDSLAAVVQQVLRNSPFSGDIFMFSDFKSRGFGVEDTQIQHPDRLARLLLVMALALYTAVSTGLVNPTPAEKRPEASAKETRTVQNIPVYQRIAIHRPHHTRNLASPATLVNRN